MKKWLFAFFILSVIFTKSQIKLTINSIERNKNFLTISIINNTSDTYILPIDTVGFKTYHQENKCNDFFMMRNYPDLGLIPMISDSKSNYIEAFIQNKGELISDNNPYRKNDEKYKKRKEKIIKEWKEKNKINDKDNSWINVNHYVYNHLIILKPHQKITFKKKFDYTELNESKEIYSYDYYPLEKGIKYDMFLKICIDESVYQYLTKKQVQKFKNYIFFKGVIESNKLSIN